MTGIDDVKRVAANVASEIKMMAPPWIMNTVEKVMDHPGTPWFFLGTGVEALGITIQYQYFEASYPILDFVAGFAIFAYLAYWQNLPSNGGDVTDAEGDVDEEEAGDEPED